MHDLTKTTDFWHLDSTSGGDDGVQHQRLACETKRRSLLGALLARWS